MSHPTVAADAAPMPSNVKPFPKRKKPQRSPAAVQMPVRSPSAARIPVVGTISDGGVVHFSKKRDAKSAADALTEARELLAAGFYGRAFGMSCIAQQALRNVCGGNFDAAETLSGEDASPEFEALNVDFDQTNDEFGVSNLFFVRVAVTILRQDWRQTERSVRRMLEDDPGAVEQLINDFRRARKALDELAWMIKGAERRIAVTMRKIAPDYPTAG